jgi:hypothetical protein
MFGRGPFFLVAVLAAVAVPYWLSEHELPKGPAALWQSMWQTETEADSASTAPPWNSSWPVATTTPYNPYGGANPTTPAPSTTSAPWNAPAAIPGSPASNGPSIAGPRAQSLPEIFRFDIHSAWIMNTWGRVSTGLIEQDLEGMRVTVISGTGQHDIAGSLTYYFDRQYQVQRIHFSGFSPDPRQLVEFITRQFGLQPEPLLGAGLFLRRDGDRLTSAMRVQHASVVRASSPNQRYAIALELNRPDHPHGLSPSFAKMLDSDRRARLWSPQAPTIPEDSEKTGTP